MRVCMREQVKHNTDIKLHVQLGGSELFVERRDLQHKTEFVYLCECKLCWDTTSILLHSLTGSNKQPQRTDKTLLPQSESVFSPNERG